MAVDFDGTDDRIDWANVFDATGQPMTVSLWAYFDTVSSDKYMFCINQVAATFGVILWNAGATVGSGALRFSRTGATGKFRNSATGTIATGAWTHILATDDGVMTTGTSAQMYVNGSEVTYGANQNGVTEATQSGTWSLGGRTQDNIRNHDGRLAEVGVWNRVLGAGEIAALADAHSPIFYPNGLRFWCPLTGRGTEINRLGAAASTTVGTTYVEHPRIIYPRRSRLILPGAAAPASSVGTGLLKSILLDRRRLVA